jgi:hypothetical protein
MENVNVAPSFVRTIFSTYAIPDEYEPDGEGVRVRVQAVPGATADVVVHVPPVGLVTQLEHVCDTPLR